MLMRFSHADEVLPCVLNQDHDSRKMAYIQNDGKEKADDVPEAEE